MQSISVVCQDSYFFLQRYYECKNLQMIQNEWGSYYPNPNITGNSLNDSFFQSLNLQSKTFSQAMAMYKKIYDETSKKGAQCKKVCQCFQGYMQFYQVYFRNAKSVAGVVTIYTQYINAYKSYMLTEAQILNEYYYKNGKNFTTLAKFSIKNDFTYYRSYFYNYNQTQNLYNCWKNPTDLVNYTLNVLFCLFCFYKFVQDNNLKLYY